MSISIAYVCVMSVRYLSVHCGQTTRGRGGLAGAGWLSSVRSWAPGRRPGAAARPATVGATRVAAAGSLAVPVAPPALQTVVQCSSSAVPLVYCRTRMVANITRTTLYSAHSIQIISNR